MRAKRLRVERVVRDEKIEICYGLAVGISALGGVSIAERQQPGGRSERAVAASSTFPRS